MSYAGHRMTLPAHGYPDGTGLPRHSGLLDEFQGAKALI
jgi:hypothetical protein